MKLNSLEMSIIVTFLIISICSTETEANVLKHIKEFILKLFSSDEESSSSYESKNENDLKRYKRTFMSWKSCGGTPLDLSTFRHAGAECEEEFGVNKEWTQSKKLRLLHSTCFRVCQLEQLGWIHDSDETHLDSPYFNYTLMHESIEEVFPKDTQEYLKTKFSSCASSVDSFNDENECKNFRGVFNCMDRAVSEKCKKKMKQREKMSTKMPDGQAQNSNDDAPASEE